MQLIPILIDIYQNWTKSNDLPQLSADELLWEIEESKNPSPEKVKWLKKFISLWDGATERDNKVKSWTQ